jgi:elongation factor P
MLDERAYAYLYNDDEGFHFMNKENYDQIVVSKDVVGDMAVYLQEDMECQVAIYQDLPVSIEIPARVTLEVVDTEPVTKGQTASSSYKPAMLSNGVKSAVPPHVGIGTRIVVMTVDGSYVERAKD